MGVNINSKIGDLLNDPKAAEIMEKHFPGFSKDPRMGMAKTMTLKQVAPMSGGLITDAKLNALEEDFKGAGLV